MKISDCKPGRGNHFYAVLKHPLQESREIQRIRFLRLVARAETKSTHEAKRFDYATATTSERFIKFSTWDQYGQLAQ
jgi:hypothetical protein